MFETKEESQKGKKQKIVLCMIFVCTVETR